MKRLLTDIELEFLVDFIKPNKSIPYDSSESIIKYIKEKLWRQLRTLLVYPEIIPELKEVMKKYYIQSLIQPGESVGIICAQSLGEKNTQSTLNTFHTTGMNVKSVTVGVPRVQELLNASKSSKNINCKIYFNERNENIQDLRMHIGSKLVALSLKDLSETIDMKLNKEREDWYESFSKLYNDNFEGYEHCVSIKFRNEMLYRYRLSLVDIAKRIDGEYQDLHCVFSPQSLGRLDVFIDITHIEFTEKQLLFVTDSNRYEIYVDECVLPILEKMLITGVEGIKNIYYGFDSLQGDKQEWFVETDGSNFKKLLGHPIVDMKRLRSNNVWDILGTLGIEASRDFLLEEFQIVMEGINICHIKLLVDKMTYGGTISSITRYTLRKDECGPLSKASFEESCDHFQKSAFAGDTERTRSVSAAIICGKRAQIGTGMMDLKIDTDKLLYGSKGNRIFKNVDLKETRAIQPIKSYNFSKE